MEIAKKGLDIEETVEKKEEISVEEYNLIQVENLMKSNAIRPGRIMYYKVTNYEGEVVDLEIKFPSTKDRFVFFNLEVSKDGKTTVDFESVMEMMLSNKLIREKKTNKVIDLEDYPIGEMVALSGHLFQLCTK